jgi:ferrous iron transport protein A
MNYEESIPLTHAPVGRKVRLVEIRGGREITHRLVELGLTPGVVFKVLQDSGGPLLLQVRNSRIALGRGMAFRVHVSIEEQE